MTTPFKTAASCLLMALLGATTAAQIAGTQPTEDVIVLTGDEYRALLGRLEAIENILGPDVQMGLTLQNLKARVDTLETDEKDEMHVSWKDGLRFENDDVKFKIGGRIQFDSTWVDESNSLSNSAGAAGNDDIEDLLNGTEFRNSRLYIQGSIYDQYEFKAQYNFSSGGEASFKDVYMKFLEVPVIGNVKVGQFKEPFSLEELTSSNYITFTERALPNALVPGRSSGIATEQSWNDGAMNWAIGVFADGSDDQGVSEGDGNGAITTRVAGTPVYQQDGERFLHLGASFSNRSFGGETQDPTVNIGVRPEVHQTEKLMTAEFDADGVMLSGFELAYQDGPFSMQAEQINADFDADDADNPNFHGYYVQASYFLTEGDRRGYKRKGAVFDRVDPKRPYITKDGQKGIGAWELAYRISELDFDDGMVGDEAGKLNNQTLGLNWYLSRNTRIMLDHVHTDLDDRGDDIGGDADYVVLRFQTDF